MLQPAGVSAFSNFAGAIYAAPPRRHYLSNSALLVEIRISKRTGVVTERLGIMLATLAERRARHRWFNGYSYREDLVAEAIAVLVAAVFKFDGRRKNPFAFLSTTAHNALLRALQKEHKHTRIRDAVFSDIDPETFEVDYEASEEDVQ